MSTPFADKPVRATTEPDQGATITDKPPAEPVQRPAKPDRAAREAAALRANLLKRKDQARQREEAKPKPKS